MLPKTRYPLLLISVLLIGRWTGEAASPKTPVGPSQQIRLAARLASPTDVTLEWKDPVPGAAGHIVEWTTDPQSGYTILEFARPGQTTFQHPDLMPDTTCYYRVRAYYGQATKPVEISLPKELSDAAYAAAYAKPEDYSWAPPRTLPDRTGVEKKSLRDPATAAAAAPTDLNIALVPSTVSGFKLTWTDHANDEEGYLIEIKPSGSTGFHVCAVVAPKTNSFGWAFEPPLRKAALRVRAFYYGRPSNIVHLTTGSSEPQKNPAGKPLLKTGSAHP